MYVKQFFQNFWTLERKLVQKWQFPLLQPTSAKDEFKKLQTACIIFYIL